MKCYACGNRLSESDFCPSCGTDVKLYKKIMQTSNSLYNEGLEKANVRDLSGAILSLKESLKYNKMNIDARNLLGLCYFERGEVVLALSEWIISRNYESKKNIADEYITELQSNPARLDTINQTIKKYNQALNYCYQNSQDLAIIQLKKVLSINENLIVGYQLLALLYMEAEDYDKARRTLMRAIKIDTNDTTTQRYLKEINRTVSEQAESGNRGSMLPQDIVTYQNGTETIIQPVNVKERRSFSSVINIVIGLVIGFGISWYLILPSRIEQAAALNDEKFVAVSEELAAEKASHQESLKALETANSDNELLTERIATLSGMGATSDNDHLLLAAYAAIEDADDSEGIMSELDMVAPDYLTDASQTSRDLYDRLKNGAAVSAIKKYTDTAKNALKTKDYDVAIEYYTKAWELDQTNSDNLMALAYAYRESGDTATADELYMQVLRDFSETNNALDAANYITGNQEE